MKTTYNIKKAFRYGAPMTCQIMVDDDFEFSECSSSLEIKGYESYLCVVEEASRYKEILKDLENSQVSSIFYLPHDIAIISLLNVKFQVLPRLISMKALNDKLKVVREETTWVEIQIDSLDILSVYRLSWVEGEEYVTLCYIENRNSSEVANNSILYGGGYTLDAIEKDVFSISDHVLVATETGEEAKILWNSLLGKALERIGYDQEFYDPDYNFDRYK